MIGDNPETDIRGGKLINAITFQKIHNRVKIGKDDDMPDCMHNMYGSGSSSVALSEPLAHAPRNQPMHSAPIVEP